MDKFQCVDQGLFATGSKLVFKEVLHGFNIVIGGCLQCFYLFSIVDVKLAQNTV